MSTMFVVNNFNLFVGLDPGAGKHLTLQEMKLPALQAQYQDHMAGGAAVGIEIETGINKLEPTFKLVGVDPQALTQFGLGSKIKNVFSAYGVVQDRRTGREIEMKVIMEGRLGKVDAEAYQKGNLLAHDYAINEVTHYEVFFDRRELVYWDFYENVWRIDGVDQNGTANQIMRIA
jgi:P2 family phage contractile tail tube protein